MSIYQNFTTTQNGINKKLAMLVERYNQHDYLRPFPIEQLTAFELIKAFANKFNGPLILDSGCGTGLSTTNLAKKFPDHGIIGIDRSAARIARANHTSATNYLIVRGDLIDIWRLLARENFKFTHHFIFYPNPYPKESQVKRRFYASPVFGPMIKLGQYFELRTNWQVYAQECALALNILGHNPRVAKLNISQHISLFEKKYSQAQCQLFAVTNTIKTF